MCLIFEHYLTLSPKKIPVFTMKTTKPRSPEFASYLKRILAGAGIPEIRS